MGTQEKPKKRGRTVLRVIGWVLIALLLVIVTYSLYCSATGRIPQVFGHSCMRIVSPSMEPTIPVGTYILTKEVPGEDIVPGDIITFFSEDPAIKGQACTHRVVSVREDGGQRLFVTKGDNNVVADALPVPQEHLIGRYQRSLPVLTTLGGLLSNQWVFLLVVLIPAGIVLVMEIVSLTKKSKQLHEDELVRQEVERLRRQDEQKRVQEQAAETPPDSASSGEEKP